MSSKTRRGRAGRSNTPAQVSPTPTQTSAVDAQARASQQAGKASPQSKSSRQPLIVWIAAAAGVLVLAVLVAWLLGIFQPKAGPAAPSPDGRISFVRKTAEGKADLFVINPDGTNEQQATRDIVIEGTNTWSHDGRQILVQASVGGTSTVVRLDVGPDNKASNAVQLTADIKADSAFPTWSPDGTMIAFQSKRDGGDYQIFVMNADGSSKRRLSDGKGHAGQPSWSSDSKNIVFRQGAKPDAGQPKELYVVPAAGGTPKQITSLKKDLSSPQWSPDGKSIAYMENVGDRQSVIHIMNADGTGDRVLVTENANRQPEFSPCGDKLAYYSIGTGSDVYTIPIAGGATSNLTHLSAEDYEETWAPNCTRLAWASRRDNGYKIVVGGVDGSSQNQKVITKGSSDDYQPSWGVAVK